MKNALLLVAFVGVIASGCFIVTDDKPANSAPTSTTATTTATTAPTTPPPPRKFRRAPPQTLPDGGF
jgi:hypothetical protein